MQQKMLKQNSANYKKTRRGIRRKDRSETMNDYVKGQIDLIKYIQSECKAIQMEANGIDIVLDMINFINELEPIPKQYTNK